jgi:hypothetical protein
MIHNSKTLQELRKDEDPFLSPSPPNYTNS